MSRRRRARGDRSDARQRRLPGAVDERPRGFVEGVEATDGERRRRVAVHAVDVGGHVDVDDVAVTQRTVVGDPVAHDLVHRRAHRLRVRAVAERARVRAARHVRGVGDRVELVGGDAGRHGCAGLRQHLGRDATGVAQTNERVAVDDLVARRWRAAAGPDVRGSGDRRCRPSASGRSRPVERRRRR